MKAFKFTVIGIVQGVGFRYFVFQHANRLNLTGYVKNMADQSVQVWVEGSEASCDEMHQQLGKGPAYARVDKVIAESFEPSGKWMTFSIESEWSQKGLSDE